METRRIHLRGRVQGVGLRPALWRLAQSLGLRGELANDPNGVTLTLTGPGERLDRFLQAIPQALPPTAHLEAVHITPLPLDHTAPPLRITTSLTEGEGTPVIPPDTAPCPTCRREWADPRDRRHRYPFINCAHCGPRLSVIRALPYDRPRTTLADFPLCPACQAEYQDPADRRFHAQATACPVCGPRVWLSDNSGRELRHPDPIACAAQRLRQGEILAVKGVGGFHLACDARHSAAVRRLRAIKHRPRKPLALLFPDLDSVRSWCHLEADEAEILAGPAAPIVLLRARDPHRLPDIAPGLHEWGVMLPPSTLHLQLARELAGPLVLTSGNPPGEPPCLDNAEAVARLGHLVDGLLLHDRPIAQRVDDSLVRRLDGRPIPLRIGRGLAPLELPLPSGIEAPPTTLAMGGDLKNAPALAGAGRVVLTPHQGDLGAARALVSCAQALDRLEALHGPPPQLIAVDRHPAYHATRLGREWARRRNLPVYAVQHHHAHLAACLADHGIPLHAPPVLGILLDGTGLGEDGSGWGGEFLLGGYQGVRRLARLRPIPMPGGDAVAREPWRAVFAHLHTALGQIPPVPPLQDHPVHLLRHLLTHPHHAPMAVSTGRLFDAVAALLSLVPARLSHEGEAAMRLEAAVDPETLESPYPFALHTAPQPWVIDPAPLWPALLNDLRRGCPPGVIAGRFHAGLACILAHTAIHLARRHDIHHVALSGGVFANRILLEALAARLRRAGLTCLTHRRIPPNDGGLAVGQAMVAAACAIQRGDPR